MTSTTAGRSDRKFAIGLGLMIFGYAFMNVMIYLAVLAFPFYVVGTALVLLSRKPWKTKLLITILPLIVNYFSIVALLAQF
jgi:hypothetical protein